MQDRINVNEVMDTSEVKPKDKAIGNALYGFSHGTHLPVLESNTDSQGIVFFTRPQLNMHTSNIRNSNYMEQLLDNNELSMNRFVRVTLDPRCPYELNSEFYSNEKIDTPLVDKNMPFIPILSNTLTNLSGWPDSVVPTFTSSSGLRKEQIAMIDGTFEVNDVFTLSATFKNFLNEPLTTLFEKWGQYASLVFEGMLYPYLDFITENEFDYNTRIYKFTLDKSNRFITKSFVTGASFPSTWPSGKYADFSRDKPYNEQTNDININFVCMGARYNYVRNLLDFNRLVATFHPDVKNFLTGNASHMVPIDYDLLKLFDFRGYPIINLETFELVWLISTDSPSYKKYVLNEDEELLKKNQPIAPPSQFGLSKDDPLGLYKDPYKKDILADTFSHV